MLNIGRTAIVFNFFSSSFDFVQINLTQNGSKSINNEKSINQVAKNIINNEYKNAYLQYGIGTT